MNCGYGEKLVLYFYGETAGELRAGIEAHLASCAACRAELKALEAAEGWLKAAAAEPPAASVAAVLAEARRAAKPAWFGLRGWRDAVLGGALAAALAAGFSLSNGGVPRDLAWNSGLDSGLDAVEYSLYSAQSDLYQAQGDLEYGLGLLEAESGVGV